MDQGEQLFVVKVVAIQHLGPLVMVVYYWKGELYDIDLRERT
jgi:hypothetical protein